MAYSRKYYRQQSSAVVLFSACTINVQLIITISYAFTTILENDFIGCYVFVVIQILSVYKYIESPQIILKCAHWHSINSDS